jgi:hypothetical protein
MSYLLFGITSTGSGQRGEWGLGPAERPATGFIGNRWVDVDRATFSESEAAAAAVAATPGRAGFHDLTTIAEDGWDGSTLEQAIGDAGRVLSVTPTARSTLDVDDADGDGLASGYDAGHLRIGLAEADWNWIKNLELLLISIDLASGRFDALTIFNVVDVRLKLGDTPPLPAQGAGMLEVDVVNAKRGEFDFADAPSGVRLDLAVWSNTVTTQNSFTIAGSAFADVVVVTRGELSTGSEIAAATPGLVQSGQNIYMGWQTGITADLGDGDDLFLATDWFRYAGLVRYDLQTNDRVFGGDGNDTIRSGNGSDVIEGGADRGTILWNNDDLTPGVAQIVAGDNLSGRGVQQTFERNVFRWSKGDGVDVITDFRPYEDMLVLGGIDSAPTQTAVTYNGVASLLITDDPGDAEGVLLFGIANAIPVPDIYATILF